MFFNEKNDLVEFLWKSNEIKKLLTHFRDNNVDLDSKIDYGMNPTLRDIATSLRNQLDTLLDQHERVR